MFATVYYLLLRFTTCVHTCCYFDLERLRKLEKVGEGWRRLEKVGESSRKLEEVRECTRKCEKV